MKIGDDVKYKNKQTFIEFINKDGTCVIMNTDWKWEEEGLCVDNDIDYDVPYWIKVNLKELTK
tara:strand:- start:419 stop:607 length:189 start_codon:yes stop_codon:yes gene_type:complete